MDRFIKKRINLLYDETARYYHVIINITGEMAKNSFAEAVTKDAIGT